MTLYLGENLIAGTAIPIEPTRNVGQIIQSTLPLTDAGLHLLDGTVIQGSGIYSAFVNYIASIYDVSANYFCTETEWQTAVSTYGVCGKFVYDSVNNTVRLPLYNSKIYTGGGQAGVKGNGTTLGLTDGTYYTGLNSASGTYNGFVVEAKNLYGTNIGTAATAGSVGTTKSLGVTEDLSKSGLIADLSNITTSLDGYYYIVVATTTKTDIEVDIDQVTTDLNQKVDKSSLKEVHVVVETYQSGTSWYRVYDDGWCEQGGKIASISNSSTSTVTFIKPFINVMGADAIGNYTRSAVITLQQITTTSAIFQLYQAQDNVAASVYWRAYGYTSLEQ